MYIVRMYEYNASVFVKCNILTVTQGKFKHFPFSTDKGAYYPSKISNLALQDIIRF